MATVVEELIIALRADGGQLRTELNRLLRESQRTGRESERALKPFSSALERIGAEARAGLRPLSDYRDELRRQAEQLERTARAQDRNSAEYRRTVDELTRVKRELAAVTTELRTQETLWDRIGGGMTRFGGVLSVGVTAPLAVLGATGVRSAQQLEVFGKTLETLIGDADRARAVFEELYEFDTQTTFAWPNLTKATTLLAAFNFEAEELIPTLGMLGDIAAGVNMSIDELAEIYGKARVQGRLFMEDINQLTGRGIPVIQELAKQFGVTEDQVRSLVSEGRVGFEHIEQAFISLTSEGGRFFGLMAAQTDTSAGKLMALRKEFEQVTDLVGEALLPTLDAMVQRARSAVEWFVNLDEATQSLIVNTGIFVAAVGPALVVVGQMVTAVQRLRTALIALRAAGLLSFGPAGWAALAVTAGAGLALALSGKRDSLDAAAERASEALASGDQDSLLSALQDLERFADRDMRETLQGLQEEIRRTGEVSEETAAEITASVREAQAAPLRAQLAALQVQRESLLERRGMITTPEAFDPAATEAEIERLRAEGNALLDAGREAEAAAVAERIRSLETALHMSEAEWERTRRQSEESLANIDEQIAAIDAQIADIEARLDALTSTTPDTARGGATQTATTPAATPAVAEAGKKVRTAEEVLADLEKARRDAREIAAAHGDTLEALAQETQANIAATTSALTALISEVGLDSTHPLVQQLVADLRALGAEADRLRNATTPRKLAIEPVAEVDAATIAALDAMREVERRQAEVASRVQAGAITSADAMREELEAIEDELGDLSRVYADLAPEHQEYYRQLEARARSLRQELERLERQEAARAAAAIRAQELDDAIRTDVEAARARQAEVDQERLVRERQAAAVGAALQAALESGNTALMREALADLDQFATRFGQAWAEALFASQRAQLEREIAAFEARMARAAALDDAIRADVEAARARQAEVDQERVRRENRMARVASLIDTARGTGSVEDARRALAEIDRFRVDFGAAWAETFAVHERYLRRVIEASEQAAQRTDRITFNDFTANAAARREVLQQLARDLALADMNAEAFGDALGGAAEKARLVQAAITTLISLGLAPSSATIQQLVADLEHWQAVVQEAEDQEERLQRFRDAVETAKGMLGELPGPIEENIATLREYRDSLDMSEEGAEELREELERLIAALERLQAIASSPLKELADNLGSLSNVTTGLASRFARGSADVAEGLRLIADEGKRLEGVASIIRGVTEAIQAVTDAAEEGGLDGNEILDLIGGIGSVAAEAIGTLTGIPGLGQVVAASFELVKSVIGDLGNGLAEIREQVEETARRTTYVGRAMLDQFAAEYTRRVSRGGIAGSFGATKAELDQEAFDAAVQLAETFGSAIASALAADNWQEALDLGFDRLIRDQLIEAFILSPEIQALIQQMVEFWNRAWEDGRLDASELAEWDRMRAELLAAGKAAREQLEELGLLEEETAKPRSTGSRITELTGPSRDFFADLLAPLRHLGAQLATLQDIRNILATRLPTVAAGGGTMVAAGSGVVINGPITITPATDRFDARALFDELSRIAQRRARGV